MDTKGLVMHVDHFESHTGDRSFSFVLRLMFVICGGRMPIYNSVSEM